jgi:DNA-binding HxlR family transcriptional regulator
MPVKRSYADHGDACATAHAVELIGDRWTYPVIRELLLAPKRFGELADAVLGITPAVLTSRLREMETAGLVERITLPAPASVAAYQLTPWARELGPLLRSLGRWAHGSPLRGDVPAGGLTPDGVVQSMLTMAPSEPPRPGLELQLELSDGRVEGGHDYTYRLTWDETGLTIERGAHPTATAILRADSSALAGMLYQTHALPPGQQGMVTGDSQDVARLLAAFPTP